MKLRDGTTKPFEPKDKVIYVPKHLLHGDRDKMTQKDNLGTVTSKNSTYVFVRFLNQTQPKACYPRDLFFLHARPDLEKIIEQSS